MPMSRPTPTFVPIFFWQTLDTDITGAVGTSLGAHLPATAANISDIKLSDKTFTYSICKVWITFSSLVVWLLFSPGFSTASDARGIVEVCTS